MMNPRSFDAKALGKTCLRYWSRGVKKSLQACVGRERQVLHLAYTDLVRDPIGAARAVYEYFQLPGGLSEETEQSMRQWLQEQAGERKKEQSEGTHQYSLSDYGLTEADLKEEMTEYYATFMNNPASTNIQAQLDAQKRRLRA
eukprot:g30297.t1